MRNPNRLAKSIRGFKKEVLLTISNYGTLEVLYNFPAFGFFDLE